MTPVKTVSLRQQSEPPFRRPTTSPQMPRKSLIPPGQMTNQTQSLSLTARVLSLSMARTAKRQYPTKRKVPPANTPRCPRPLQPSSVFIPIVRPPLTESLHTKKTTTVTRKRRAKRTTWSPRLLVLVILSPKQILEGTTAPHQQKALDRPGPAPPHPVTMTVLMTMVRQHPPETLMMRMFVCFIVNFSNLQRDHSQNVH